MESLESQFPPDTQARMRMLDDAASNSAQATSPQRPPDVAKDDHEP